MLIYLYRVNRGLNRCIRTAYSFGFENIFLVDCGKYDNRLFSAKRIRINRTLNFSFGKGLLLEKNKGKEIRSVNLKEYDFIILGGESIILTKKIYDGNFCYIQTKNDFCLTSPVALSIFCWEYQKC